MKRKKNLLGILAIFLTIACSAQKSVKNKSEISKKESLTNVQNDSVVTIQAENRKIPEMGLNVWIFNYTPENRPGANVKTALLVFSDTSSALVKFSDSEIKIFLDERNKVLGSLIRKERTDSIVQKLFFAKN